MALSEFQNVFADVSISSERMKMLQKSARGTHFEATVTCFEEIPRTQRILGQNPQITNLAQQILRQIPQITNLTQHILRQIPQNTNL